MPDFADIDETNSISFLLGMKKPPLEPNEDFKYEYQPFFFKENDKTVLVVTGKVVDTIARVGAVTDNSKMVIYDDSKKGDDELPRLDMAVVVKWRKWFYECIRTASEADPRLPSRARKRYHLLEVALPWHVLTLTRSPSTD